MIFILRSFLIVFFFSLSFASYARQPAPQIALNQVGFYPTAEKTAIIINAPGATGFYILSVNKKDTFYKGNLGKPLQSLYSSSLTKKANFTTFKKSGTFILYVPEVGFSYPFDIGKNVYHEVARASVKAYYFQRASMPLEAQYAGTWSRKEGHPDTVVFIHPSAASPRRAVNTIIASPGGWYDAGDYNKYIVNSGITMGTLLSACEDFPLYFDTLKTNIPQTEAGIPDLLAEILYNLRWMFTMQDREDGGVYHKCTNAQFDAMVMPDAAITKRYVVQKGTAATLDFAAVMAQASRVCKRFPQQLPGLADSCLSAAALAWQWAIKYPAMVYDQDEMNKHFLPAIVTGTYGDKSFKDEFFWAAAELLATSADTAYLAAVNNAAIGDMVLPSWANVHMLGCYTLLRFKKQLSPVAGNLINNISKKITSLADGMLANGGNKAFATIFGQSRHDFVWGSNAVAMNESILLINASLITGNKKYLQPALSNINYVLGQNATGYSFITGFGSKPAMHPHHRQSIADGIEAPVPGLLVGGPNPGMQDKCLYTNTETETAYTDSDCAYACNEIAINWNAPLVYAINAIEALQSHLQ